MEKYNLNEVKDLARLVQEMAEGTTLGDLKGLTKPELEAIYSVGYNMYRTGRTDDAEKVFKVLALLEPMSAKYLMALGAVRQVKRDFPGAVKAYALASFYDIEDPKPQYHAAECFLAMGDRENAGKALDTLDLCANLKTERGRTYAAKAKLLRQKTGLEATAEQPKEG